MHPISTIEPWLDPIKKSMRPKDSKDGFGFQSMGNTNFVKPAYIDNLTRGF